MTRRKSDYWKREELDHGFSITLRSNGREFDSRKWREEGEAQIMLWRDYARSFRPIQFEMQKCRIALSFDVSGMERVAIADLNHEQAIRDASGKINTKKLEQFPFPKEKGRIKVSWSKRGSGYSPNLMVAVTMSRLIDLFVMANLSCPASVSFHRCGLSPRTPLKYEQETLHTFTAFPFDASTTTDYEWPPVAVYLPIDATRAWYEKIRRDSNQLPSSRLERALFAVMHICCGDPLAPTTTIWICHALECLYDTRPSSNFSTLVQRIPKIVGANPNELKFAKDNLREIYNLRNSFVHGGGDFGHPLKLDNVDGELDKEYSRHGSAMDFGFRLILSTIQTLIARGWTGFSFEDSLSITETMS